MSISRTVEVAEEEAKLRYIGEAVPRFEDLRLAKGTGAFADDLPVPPNLHHAIILRSTYAHARIRSIDVEEALKVPGVKAVLTGRDIAARLDPFPSAIRSKAKYYPIAVEKVRYSGEPVAVVVASDPYTAQDALDLIRVEYDPLPAVADPLKSIRDDAPIIHEEIGSNIFWARRFRFGDPEKAFSTAWKTVRIQARVNRFTIPPMEPYIVIASYDSASGILTEWCNFQGPFTFYYIASRALRLTDDKFRVITPKDIGGGFGDKTALAFYMTLIGVTVMLVGVPVKWVETRTEHFIGSTRAAGRFGTYELAFTRDGTLTALKAEFVDDIGAFPRSPEPGHLLRQLGNFVGPYRIRHVAIDAKSVGTNTVPTSPIRGFGGQHLYFSLEKLVTLAARELGMDPVELRLKNFIRPDEFPYETPTGGIYDSGNYEAALKKALELIDYERTKNEIEKAQGEGRALGLGIAVGIDPSVSNMGYLDVASIPEVRVSPEYLPKSGGEHTAMLKIDPMGKVTCQIDSCPQGQGHETVISQIVASVLNNKPEDVSVIAGMDTHTQAWSVSAGTYSSRFGSVGVSAVYKAAMKLRDRMLRVASKILNAPVTDLEMSGGRVYVRQDRNRSVSFTRIAGSVHWNPGLLDHDEDLTLYTSSTYHIPTLKSPTLDDKSNSSGTYGFIADAILVEVDPETGVTKILKYVSVHDSGTVINPGIVAQQCQGAASQGLAQALYQELIYDENGQPLTANFGDFYVPTPEETVPLTLGHTSTRSPFTALGSKGVGESNNETAPAAVSLAIEDALRKWKVNVDELPITPQRLWHKIQDSKRTT